MKNFKDLYVLQILHIIHHRLSVIELIDLGLDYSQISKLLNYVIEDNLVVEADEFELMLTQAGENVLVNLRKRLYPSEQKDWLLPKEEYRIPKFDKFDVYLPQNKNIFE